MSNEDIQHTNDPGTPTAGAAGPSGWPGPAGPADQGSPDDPPTWPGWSPGAVEAGGAPASPAGSGGSPPGGFGPGTPPPGGPGAPGGGYPPGYGYGGYPPGYGYGGYPPGYGGWGGAAWPPPGGWGAPGTGAPGGPAQRGPRRHLLGGALALLAAVALLLGVGIGYTVWSPSTGTTARTSRPLTPRNPFGSTRSTTSGSSTSGGSRSSSAAGSPSDISGIASKVDPGLVDVNTVLGYQTGQAAGTGMVLTSNGEVLTNNHVIEGATTISATDIGNGKTYKASVVGYNRTLDVAVIQLKGATGLQTVSTDTSTVSTGEAVVGIGNAGGLGGAPATAGGSVVALDQSITASDQADSTTEHLTGLIETNARIEAGDSGGPLVNASGHVIGMDTAASTSGGFTFRGATGNGYAIPISTALGTAKQIAAGNASSTVHIGATAFLGVGVKAVGATNGGAATRFLRPGSTATTTAPSTSGSASSGAAVVRVLSGTPAQQAGIASGDVITSLGGKPVTSPNSLSDDLLPYHPGDKVSVQWTNAQGQTQTATIQLATGPAA